MTTQPGGLLDRYDLAHPEADARAALDIVHELQAECPELRTWTNFPLFNASGDEKDLRLQAYSGSPQETPYGRRLPEAARIVRVLSEQGFDISYARIAVLFERDVLRPHVDMQDSIRLIIPFNDQRDDFRHVFGPIAVAMRTGELWVIDGQTCHGAANISRVGRRVALLVDARTESSTPPDFYFRSWHIPSDRRLTRCSWDAEAQQKAVESFTHTAKWTGVDAAERAWHFTSFEFNIHPELAYQELISLLDRLAETDSSPEDAELWSERAEYWRHHKCVCVPG